MLVINKAMHVEVKSFDLFALRVDPLPEHELNVLVDKDVGLFEGV